MRGDEVARTVGLSVTAARFHLDRLVTEGLVRAAPERRDRPGRPHVVYEARPIEAVDSATAYRLLAGMLAAELSRTGDATAPVEAGRRWADRILESEGCVAGTATADRDGGLPGVLEQIMKVLDDNGFEPRAAPDGDAIELHRCPFLELATERTDVVCGLHLGLLRGMLERLGGLASVRVIPVLDGSGPCLVRVQAGHDSGRRTPTDRAAEPEEARDDHDRSSAG